MTKKTPNALEPFKVEEIAQEIEACDVVVVGSGLAGLTAALELAPRRVTLLTKTELQTGGSSSWAQGGVAAAMGQGDSPRAHAADTVEAGAGLNDELAVDVLTREGPERIRRLIELGARFDRDAEGRLLLGREGAHGRRRILHAGGDATGAEMVRALCAAVKAAPHVAVREHAFVEDLVLDTLGRIAGVVARHPRAERLLPDQRQRIVFHRAPAVVLATGGFGQLYRYTTNPPAATGDGVAMAARAGAELADLEFVQFHPTALLAEADPLPLVTEALRGEGAVLLNDAGERFMLEVDERAELAPRDLVARAIFAQQRPGHRVWLDATEALGDDFPRRFPTVYESCRKNGLDPRREPIPVTPAAHYVMGGIATDARGCASLPGLWACGETAASGVHGANRLASNSLLEALVFGARVAADVAGAVDSRIATLLAGVVWREPEGDGLRLAALGGEDEVRRRVRRLMWEKVGLVRDRQGLEAALAALGEIAAALPAAPTELSNLALLGRLVSGAALAREESRGAHHRSDFPHPAAGEDRRLRWTYGAAAPGAAPLVPAGDVEAREIA